MNCISLIQPWATLWATGHKQIETRSWPTNFRGTLFIHASSTYSEAGLELFDKLLWLNGEKFESLPRGRIIGSVIITNCLMMTPKLISEQNKLELLVGEWKPGRFAWIGTDHTVLDEPIPARGSLGIWKYVPGSDIVPKQRRKRVKPVFVQPELKPVQPLVVNRRFDLDL